MKVWLALLVCCSPAVQDSVFESEDYGIRLRIPSGWIIDSTRQSGVMLKLKLPGERLPAPELIVHEIRSREIITLAQYKEPYRQHLQKLPEARILEDRSLEAAGRPGFFFKVTIPTTDGRRVALHKGVFELSPKRMLAVDGVFPTDRSEELKAAYEALLASIEIIPRSPPPIAKAGLEIFAELAGKLSDLPAASDARDEMEIVVDKTKIGTYTVSRKRAKRGRVEGVEIERVTRLEIDAQHVVSTVRGFLADDLSVQSVELEESKKGGDGRSLYYTSRTDLAGGRVTIERRINGEASSLKFDAPAHLLLYELLEALQWRLISLGKTGMTIPVLVSFDNEPGFVQIESLGSYEKEVEGKKRKVRVLLAGLTDGSLANYWYDEDARLVRRTIQGQSLVIRRPVE